MARLRLHGWEPPPPCPREDLHTPQPDGLDWHEWAEEMAATHDQQRCPGCGLWQIWTPKDATTADQTTTET